MKALTRGLILDSRLPIQRTSRLPRGSASWRLFHGALSPGDAGRERYIFSSCFETATSPLFEIGVANCYAANTRGCENLSVQIHRNTSKQPHRKHGQHQSRLKRNQAKCSYVALQSAHCISLCSSRH